MFCRYFGSRIPSAGPATGVRRAPMYCATDLRIFTQLALHNSCIPQLGQAITCAIAQAPPCANRALRPDVGAQQSGCDAVARRPAPRATRTTAVSLLLKPATLALLIPQRHVAADDSSPWLELRRALGTSRSTEPAHVAKQRRYRRAADARTASTARHPRPS